MLAYHCKLKLRPTCDSVNTVLYRSLLNVTVKELIKSVNTCQSYRKNTMGT